MAVRMSEVRRQIIIQAILDKYLVEQRHLLHEIINSRLVLINLIHCDLVVFCLSAQHVISYFLLSLCYLCVMLHCLKESIELSFNNSSHFNSSFPVSIIATVRKLDRAIVNACLWRKQSESYILPQNRFPYAVPYVIKHCVRDQPCDVSNNAWPTM